MDQQEQQQIQNNDNQQKYKLIKSKWENKPKK